MLPLNFPRLWFFAGCVFALAIISGSLVPGEYVRDVMFGRDKLMHAGAYAGLMFWFTGIYPRARYWIILIALAVLGLLVEELQGLLTADRQRDFGDLVANVSGTLVALAIAWLWTGGWAQQVERWLLGR